MPLIVGLPRGTWSFADGGEWSWEAELDRPFHELVGAFVECFSGITQIRSFSWGSASTGEDAVVGERPGDGAQSAALSAGDVVRASPDDPAFAVVGMDLLVVSGDGTRRTIAHRCTIFAEDEVVEGSGDGANFRFVLHTDVFRRQTSGLVGDNSVLAAENASYLDSALGAVARSLKARLVDEPELVDLPVPHLFVPAIAEVRNRHDRYLEELRREWHPASDAELIESGARMVTELAGLGDRFHIAEWQALPALSAQDFEIVDRAGLTLPGDDLVAGGAEVFRSQLSARPWESESADYLVSASRIADGPLLVGYLMSPLFDDPGSFDGAFQLWSGGGSVAVRPTAATVLRMWS